MTKNKVIKMVPIGLIRTPYKDSAPYQPVEEEGEFYLEIDKEWAQGLKDLEKFRYIYVIYYAHMVTRKPEPIVIPPWTHGKKIGVFASRSPARPNPIALSVVKVFSIKENIVKISGLDAFDGTPILDIKPYIQELDSKSDANYGWIEELPDRDHLILHIKGIPHDY